jgi:hypothetical protein
MNLTDTLATTTNQELEDEVSAYETAVGGDDTWTADHPPCPHNNKSILRHIKRAIWRM